jgi:VNT family MFS transporter (synaptic vesicle glycoprotein 2)
MASNSDGFTLENAIVETKFGKFNYFLIVLSGLILGCAFIETSSVNIIIPIAQCELEMTNFHKGLLGSVAYIGIILSSHFWGFLADTRGRKRIIVNALLLASFFTLCSTFAKNFWVLALFRFLTGFW